MYLENIVDEMGSRIDDLEKSISELMAQTGIEEDEAAGGKKQ
jgi:heat shock factor-binding protein 1